MDVWSFETPSLGGPAEVRQSKRKMATPELAQAEQFARSGKLVDAEIAYARAIQTSRDPVAFNKTGDFLKRAGRLSEAQSMYESALNSSPTEKQAQADAHRKLGEVFLIGRDLTRSEREYQQALSIDQSLNNQQALADDYRGLGNIARARRDLESAEAHFSRALELDTARNAL